MGSNMYKLFLISATIEDSLMDYLSGEDMEGGDIIKTALLMVSLAWYIGCELSVYIVLSP